MFAEAENEINGASAAAIMHQYGKKTRLWFAHICTSVVDLPIV
jgi:hypothetical protein